MVRPAIILLAIGILSACGKKAEEEDYDLRVAVSTDAAVPTRLDRLRITASRDGVERFAHEYTYAEISKLPDALLLDDGTPDYTSSEDDYTWEPIVIQAVGLLGDKEVVRRAAELELPTSGEQLLRMPLCADCFGVTCESEETCKRGTCEAWEIGSLGGPGLPADDSSLPLTDAECPDAASTCAGVCGSEGCGTCPTSTVVTIGEVEVDQLEVTRSAYAAWLETNPQPVEDALGPGCEGQTTFASDPECMAEPKVCAENCDEHPQVCVDWCSAFAYCAWAGKRLCGAVGRKAARERFRFHGAERRVVPRVHERAPRRSYPYEETFGACNDESAGIGTTVAAGSMAMCGASEGTLDMLGNAWEWQDKCSGGSCSGRGGSFEADMARCEDTFPFQRGDHLPNLGFRCCAK